MRVYTWGHSEDCIWLEVPDSRERDALRSGFHGTEMRETWAPPHVRRVVLSERGMALQDLDVSALYHWPAIKASALDKAGEFLLRFGELLPLLCDEGEYYAYNVTNLVDALNQEESEIHKFSSGRWMDVRRGVFLCERVGGAQIFKLPQTPAGPVYVTEHAAATLQESGLTGFVPWGGGLLDVPLITDDELA